MSMWYRGEAINVAKRVELAVILLGYHVALGGSVLHRGESDKDLDLFLYNNRGKTQAAIRDVLIALERCDIWADVEDLENFEEYGSKYVFRCYTGPRRERRVDVTFLVKVTDEDAQYNHELLEVAGEDKGN